MSRAVATPNKIVIASPPIFLKACVFFLLPQFFANSLGNSYSDWRGALGHGKVPGSYCAPLSVDSLPCKHQNWPSSPMDLVGSYKTIILASELTFLVRGLFVNMLKKETALISAKSWLFWPHFFLAIQWRLILAIFLACFPMRAIQGNLEGPSPRPAGWRLPAYWISLLSSVQKHVGHSSRLRLVNYSPF